jgi:hypothetical protein
MFGWATYGGGEPKLSSFRCHNCHINYPKAGNCLHCKANLGLNYGVAPDEDWNEKVQLLSQVSEPSDTEDDKITTWRAHQLVLSGAPAYEALALAQDRHIDLHKACAIFRGTDVETALAILA